MYCFKTFSIFMKLGCLYWIVALMFYVCEDFSSHFEKVARCVLLKGHSKVHRKLCFLRICGNKVCYLYSVHDNGQ